jgi:hypothetical protein
MEEAMKLVDHSVDHFGNHRFEFEENEKSYLVTRSANGSREDLYVFFERATHNVWSNGSRNVTQAGRRKLPIGGPTYERLYHAYEVQWAIAERGLRRKRRAAGAA